MFCAQPEHVIVSLTACVCIRFQHECWEQKVLVLGHEGAQTEEQMPYLSCIWPHVLVVQFWAGQLCETHRARSSTQGSIGGRISK